MALFPHDEQPPNITDLETEEEEEGARGKKRLIAVALLAAAGSAAAFAHWGLNLF